MFQKELAQRITAQPDSKDYGRLTVMLHYCANTKKLAEINASLFFPKPRVASEVLEITFNNTPEYPAANEAFFFRVIKAAFSKRRKTLKNALAGSDLDMAPKTAAQILEEVDIDPSRRAETLSVQEFVKLSNYLGDQMKAM
jgi:16S rRNA (adenine1518-N6/adenine1519-N6)-dimethyltransferase